jgi:hypothetical protein
VVGWFELWGCGALAAGDLAGRARIQRQFVETEGFGASTLAVRTADAPEGPWTDPRDVLRPPESFSEDAFVYAGKAHPEQAGADLAATYVPSSMDGEPPDPTDDFYYPRFVRISYR